MAGRQQVWGRVVKEEVGMTKAYRDSLCSQSEEFGPYSRYDVMNWVPKSSLKQGFGASPYLGGDFR